jgi:hypothetical protein
MELLESVATGKTDVKMLSIWSLVYCNLFFQKTSAPHVSTSRKRRWDQLNHVLEEVTRKGKRVNTRAKAFRATKWADVQNVLGYINYKQGCREIPANVLDLLFAQLLKIGVVFGSVSSGKEETRLQFISPVLYEVCALFDGRAKISVQKELKGVNINTSGRFEYVLEVDGRRVCVVQAKKSDMERGMAQALLGAEIVAELDDVSEVCAIVTNYRQWYFLKNMGDAIYRDVCTLDMEADVPTKASVRKIAAKIYAILSNE